MVISAPTPPGVFEIQLKKDVNIFTIPLLEELVENTWEHFPYIKDFNTARHDEAFASHTSGSTGLPSARVYSHEFITRAVRNILLPPPNGYTSLGAMTGRNRQLLLLPLFHPAGVQFGILNAVYNRTVIVLPSPSTPPSVEGLVGMMKNTEADWAVMAPSLLEMLAKDLDLLGDVSKHLKLLVFSGGSLPKRLGDAIASKIKLASFLGSSETAGYPTIFPDDFDPSADWQYAQIHPAAGVHFEQLFGDGFELVVKRSIFAELHQPVFEVFPDLQEYRTKDIFNPHPTWPDMWMHSSRSDDIIVFLNGEKTNPVTFENEVSQHPEVASVIVFGKQRFEAGLLVEAKERGSLSIQQRAAWIERIWPIIESANQHAPAHARISKDHILIVNPRKPVARTAKETIKRKETLANYSKEIDDLYADAEKIRVRPTAVSGRWPDLADTVAVGEKILSKLKSIAKIETMRQDEDFFARGIDSLTVLRLVRDLRSLFGVEQIQPGTVYLHPNAVSLAKAIRDLAQSSNEAKQEQEAERRQQLIEVMDTHYHAIDQQAGASTSQRVLHTHRPGTPDTIHTVLLTGSTGNIGSYVLRSLLTHEMVKHIYCLNRSPSSETRQRIHNAESDSTLPTSFPADRVTFLEVDIGNPTLGLAGSDFASISKTVTLIIHNAWPVNFNLPLSAFSKHLNGVTNLCRFAANAERRPTLLFLSSIAAAMGMGGTSDKPVKEEVLEDLNAPAANGYAESKYIAERLLERAAYVLGLNVRIARAGQVCGPARSKGAWKRREWLPSLVLGSRCLNAIPDSLGTYGPEMKDVDWMPVDVLAEVLIDIVTKEDEVNGFVSKGDSGTVEVFHPFKQPALGWADLVPAVLEAMELSSPSRCSSRGDMKMVSPTEWLESLRANASLLSEKADSDNSGREKDIEALLRENPAIKLLDFYQNKLSENSVLKWDTGKAERASRTLKQAKAITPNMMMSWVQDWISEGA